MNRYYFKQNHPRGRASYIEVVLKDQPMSSGGEGSVYRLSGADSWKPAGSTVTKRACAKVFSQGFLARHGKEMEEKLDFMTDPKNYPRYLDDGATNLIQICWPMSLLYDAPGGSFVGFMMYYALEDSVPLSTITIQRSEAYFKMQERMGKLNRIERDIYKQFEDPRSRMPFVFNIASEIDYFHNLGIYVNGDLKPDNFLINARGGVSLVDLNTVQVKAGRKYYPSFVATPDYVPPEYQDNPTGKKPMSFDLFSMAVIFYQILVGIHPFAYSVKGANTVGTTIQEHIRSGKFACGKNRKHFTLSPQHQRFDNLPDSLKELFKRAFEGAASRRPSAREWMNVLTAIRKAGTWPSGAPASVRRASAPGANKKPNDRCPVCGTPYLTPSSRFCHICRTPRA